MLSMSAGEIRHPIADLILMKSYDRLIHDCSRAKGEDEGEQCHFPKTSWSKDVTRAAGLVRIFCSSWANR
jgi:hypothetical protein